MKISKNTDHQTCTMQLCGQQEILATRESVNGLRVYRCQLTGLVCVVSGHKLDAELLEQACKRCKKRPHPGYSPR